MTSYSSRISVVTGASEGIGRSYAIEVNPWNSAIFVTFWVRSGCIRHEGQFAALQTKGFSISCCIHLFS